MTAHPQALNQDLKSPTLADAERYVGKPYIEGVFDCADLAAQVQWELFGVVIELPTQRARPHSPRAQARAIAAFAPKVVQQIAAPAHGCGVLMWESAAIESGANRQWHIGTAFLQNGEVWVLHSTVQAGAVLHRLPDLGRFGLHVEGFYQWM